MPEEIVLRVGLNAFKRRNGFTVDAGGSINKIVYTVEKPDCVEIHLVWFPADECKAALDYILAHCGHCFQEGDKILTTGIRAHYFEETLAKKYKVSLETISEMDCCCNGVRFLAENFPINEMTDALKPEGIGYGRGIAEAFAAAGNLVASDGGTRQAKAMEIVNKVQEKLTPSPEKKKFDPEEIYPCLVTLIGSGALFLKYDGKTFQIENDSARSGLLFLGQGALMTDVTKFEDLADLAAKGDPEGLSMTGKYLSTGGGIYAHAPKDFMVFSFGHAYGKKRDDFSKADIVAALLDNNAQDIAQMSHLSAVSAGVDNIFICGSFTGASEVVRDYVGKHLARYCMMKPSSTGNPIGFHFVKYGGFVVAIGCLDRNLNK